MFRNNWEYFLYLAGKRKKVFLSLFINLSLFTLVLVELPSAFTGAGGLAVTLGLLFNTCWSFYGLWGELSGVLRHPRLRQGLVPLDFPSMTPSLGETQLGYEPVRLAVEGRTQSLFISRPVNDYLWDRTDLAYIRDCFKEEKLRSFIDERYDSYDLFLRFKLRDANAKRIYFYNEKKLCLSRDLRPGDRAVYLHRSCYYDTHLTHHICESYLYDDDTDFVYADARRTFPWQPGAGRLLDVTNSHGSNEIGVSTLGVTKDGYLILLRQNSRANSSQGLLIPTGSGSADWKDRQKGSFTATIAYGMQRELSEECSLEGRHGIPVKELGETRITGFFRWVDRGGKPEFTGITRIDFPCNALIPNQDEVKGNFFETILLLRRDTGEFNLTALRELEGRLRGCGDCSIPLYGCVYNLLSLFEEPPVETDAQWRERLRRQKELVHFLFPSAPEWRGETRPLPGGKGFFMDVPLAVPTRD